jgi:hypothetical protein
VTFEGRDAGPTLSRRGGLNPLDPRPADSRAAAAVAEDGETAPRGFFDVPACRAIDTRDASGTWGAPRRGSGRRVFPARGPMRHLIGAKAVAAM